MKETSLQNFENQLKKGLDKKENAFTVGEIPTPNSGQVNQNSNIKQIKVHKNVIVSYLSDVTGCGHIRNIFPMNYLNSIFGKSGKLLTMVSPIFLYQSNVLVSAKTLYFQRQMTESHLRQIEQYKKLKEQFKFNMVYDIDDFIWGKNEQQGGNKEDGVPSYNFGSKKVLDDAKINSVNIMNLMDICCFSTKFLADYAKNQLKIKPECFVMPNAIPKYFWEEERKPDIKKRIKKPKILYTGSPTHYSNEDRMLGDFDNVWKDWVIKNVKENKIDFICMGGLPWFFNEIQDKIKVDGWIDSYRYSLRCKQHKADIGIMPLVPNMFNYSKSNLKETEYFSMGMPCVGTIFTNGKPSPYDNNDLSLPDNCTIEDIDKRILTELCEPNIYNKYKNQQYERMDKEGRWLESPEYINRFLSVLCRSPIDI